MDEVKKRVAAGISVPLAIRDALGMDVTAFADKYEIPRGTTSEVINLKKAPTEKQVEALIAELGGTAEEWRYFLWQSAEPVAAAS